MADGDENAQRPYLGHRMDRRAHTIIGNLSSMLAPGEQVWALFAVNSLRPQADFLVVTNCRVATGLAYTLREKGAFKEVAFADQLADVDKKGRVTATSADGDAFRLAALLYTAKDLPSLTHYVDFLRESPAPTEMLEVVKGIQSGAFVPPPPEQVYLGSVRKVDLAASVEGAQASLVPGEQLRALFAIKGPGGARLLAFTSARVVGLVAVDDQSLPKPLWAVSNTDVINLTASRSHGGITALVQRAEDAMRTDLGSLRETSDARALDYFGASPATPDDEVTEGLTLSALPRPGEQPAPSGYPSPAAVATASGVTDAIVRSRTQAEEAALNEGLPPKEVDLVTPILKGFAQAVEASARGDMRPRSSSCEEWDGPLSRLA